MKTLTLTARLLCAAAATATTLALFSAVTSLGEPQRGMLIARNHPAQPTPPAATVLAVAMASTSGANARNGR